MRLSVFTDEINRDSPSRAIELAAEWSLQHVEVRTLPGGRFPLVPHAELKHFSQLLKQSGLTASGVSPGFFKCPWDDPTVDRTISESLPNACDWAQQWGADLVTCFAFDRDSSSSVPAAVIDTLGRMSSVVQQHGCRLALENEPVCWGGTGSEAAEIIRQIGSPHLSLCWDPANSCMASSVAPTPEEYRALKDLISHVHMKNADPTQGKWSPLDAGAVDWNGLLHEFAHHQYQGFLVIETHLQVSTEEFRFVKEQLSNQEQDTLHNLNFVRSCLQ